MPVEQVADRWFVNRRQVFRASDSAISGWKAGMGAGVRMDWVAGPGRSGLAREASSRGGGGSDGADGGSSKSKSDSALGLRCALG